MITQVEFYLKSIIKYGKQIEHLHKQILFLSTQILFGAAFTNCSKTTMPMVIIVVVATLLRNLAYIFS